MYNKSKKIGLASMIIIIAVSLAIYFSPTRTSNNSNGQKGVTQSTNGTTEENKEAQKKEEQKVIQDAKKTEELKKEKEIYNGQVYVQNNMAVATMLIKDGVSETDAKALAEKYAKQLKEQYKDMRINVQAVQGGKNIANITIEK